MYDIGMYAVMCILPHDEGMVSVDNNNNPIKIGLDVRSNETIVCTFFIVFFQSFSGD